MIAIGLVRWDGIVQGFTWDIVKLAVKAALLRLQGAGIAPADADTSDKRAPSTELGFRWTAYTEGRKQREMFLGVAPKVSV
jgi:hypothetical protein